MPLSDDPFEDWLVREAVMRRWHDHKTRLQIEAHDKAEADAAAETRRQEALDEYKLTREAA